MGLAGLLAMVFGAAVRARAMAPTGIGRREWDGHLERAVTRAFADGEAFRATGLFDCLGYTATQVAEIAQVTPRPASLTVEWAAADPASGFFQRLLVTTHRVRYYDLTIERAVFSFTDIRLDVDALLTDRLVFRSVGRVGLETFVSSADILKVFDLVTRARGLSGLVMNIDRRTTRLRGRVRQGWLTVNFHLEGIPCLKNGRQIEFRCRRLVLNGLSLPQGVIRGMFSRINPVFDADQTWLNLHLDKIALEPGYVRSWGAILPAARSDPTPVSSNNPLPSTGRQGSRNLAPAPSTSLFPVEEAVSPRSSSLATKADP
jgi:hypothetical protein